LKIFPTASPRMAPQQTAAILENHHLFWRGIIYISCPCVNYRTKIMFVNEKYKALSSPLLLGLLPHLLDPLSPLIPTRENEVFAGPGVISNKLVCRKNGGING
jgi:hypothetical protein